MTVSVGSRLGPYEILSPLGAGGMGEVFRARDTRLSREVAIKVLPADVSSDPARLKRPEDEGSRQTEEPAVSLATEPRVEMGTVSYMSPEHARGRAVDFRSDQFSFGSVVYEIATSTRAFEGQSKPEILSAIIREE